MALVSHGIFVTFGLCSLLEFRQMGVSASERLCIGDFVADYVSYDKCLDNHFCEEIPQHCLERKPTDPSSTEIVSSADELYGDHIYGVVRYHVMEACRCDGDCHVHNTCCEDVYDKSKIPPVNQQCVHYLDRHFYVVTTCPEEYSLIAIKELCHTPVLEKEKSNNNAGPDVSEWFVTSKQTSYTYRNFYCALCNGESHIDLEFWSLKVTCKKRNPIPSDDSTTTTTGPPSSVDIRGCSKELSVPEVNGCSYTFIGSCPPGYSDTDVVHECSFGPMAVIKAFSNHKRYRNIYCMICNGVNSEFTCDIMIAAIMKSGGPMTSMSLLVRPFQRECDGDGDSNGMQSTVCPHLTEQFSSCSVGEFYDLRKDSCVQLCPPPLVWYNRTCVHKTADSSECTLVSPEETYTMIINDVNDSDSSLSFTAPNGSRYCVICQWSSVDLPVESDGTVHYMGVIWRSPFLRRTRDGSSEICLSVKQRQIKLSIACKMNVPRKLLTEYYLREKNVTYFIDGLEVYAENDSMCAVCRWIQLQEYTVSGTKTSVEFDGKVYSKPFYYELSNDSLMICAENTQGANEWGILGTACKLLDNPAVTLTSISISIVCLTVMIAVYTLLPVLHNVPGYIVLSQAVSLLLGLIFYLLREPATTSERGCYFVSFMTHYLLLAAYFWSSLFGIEVLLTINAKYTVNQMSRSKFLKYSIAGWMVPLIPVIVALIMDNIDEVDPNMKPQYGQPICWFTSPYGLYLYFLLPMAVIFCTNLLGYVSIVVTLAVLAYKTRGVRTSHREKLILSVKLIFACGLLWVFGILSAIFRDNEPLICIFIFLNGLYGLVLLLTFLTSGAVCGPLKKAVQTRISTIFTSSGTATGSTAVTAGSEL